MTAMPSERLIRDAIEQLKSQPGKFQLVAEQVMRIQVGGPYRNLVPQGRNADLQPTIGYPDAHARTDDGELCLIETTVGDWRKHLEKEDLPGIAKLCQSGRKVAQFNLFTMSKAELLIEQDRKLKSNAKPRAKKKSMEEYTTDLVQLGVPKDGIRFFFLDQLVAALRSSPAYSCVLAELGLPIDIAPFYPLAEQPLCEGTSPTRDEYQYGGVVAADLLATMKKELLPGRTLLVEGGSGLGKTTLAIAFGFKWLAGNGGAFYVDLDVYDDAAAKYEILIERIKQFGHPEHLFVLDNCHRLQPRLLKQLLKASAGTSNRPTILALSRKLSESAVNALCEDVGAARMHLRLRTQDMRAVYNLVASRHAPLGVRVSPSDEQFEEWLRLHGDLVSFTLALRGAGHQIAAGQLPTLTEQSAIEYLDTHYLKALLPTERQVLAGVALCAHFDAPASITSLQGAVPSQSLKSGLVLEQVASNGERRFWLAHPKIGGLLLKALGRKEEEVLQMVIEQDAFQAYYIAQRLLYGQFEGPAPEHARRKAQNVLQRVGASAWTFSARFSPGYCGVIASLYEELGMEPSFHGRLAAEISRYIAQRPDFLAGLPLFLEYTVVKGLKEANEKVWVDLEEAARSGRLSQAASLAPLSTVQSMLKLSKAKGEGPLEMFGKALSGKAVADGAAQKFGKVAPSAAEELLETFVHLAPRLHGQLHSRLVRGTLLDSFRAAISKAHDRTTIRPWLHRPRLLRLLAGDADGLLPSSMLREHWKVLLPLLMDEPACIRARFDAQVQLLFAQLGSDGAVVHEHAQMLAPSLMAMICLVDRTAAKEVEDLIRRMSSAHLKACLQALPPFNLGAMLANPSSALEGSEALGCLKSAAHELVRDRANAVVAAKTKRPGRIYVAAHLTIARLAGATGEEHWYRQVMAMAQQAPRHRLPHNPSQPRESRIGQARAAFRTEIEALFPSTFDTVAD